MCQCRHRPMGRKSALSISNSWDRQLSKEGCRASCQYKMGYFHLHWGQAFFPKMYMCSVTPPGSTSCWEGTSVAKLSLIVQTTMLYHTISVYFRKSGANIACSATISKLGFDIIGIEVVMVWSERKYSWIAEWDRCGVFQIQEEQDLKFWTHTKDTILNLPSYSWNDGDATM